MKTLLISEIFPPTHGGSGRWFWEIYRRLPRDEVVIAASSHPKQDEFDASHDLNLIRAPLSMPQWGVRSWTGMTGYWNAVRMLGKVIHDHNINRIHCGRCLPEGVMALVLKHWKGIPFSCYVHGEDINTAANSREYAFLVRRVLAGADRCIANSHNTATLLKENWRVPDHRTQVLHPGVDTTYFRPATRSEEVRKRLGWQERPVVLTVGRLQRRKGQDMMIRALSRIRRQTPGVLYSIVGNGEEREPLESLAKKEGVIDHVEFRGETTDQELLECYQQCDLFALPNREIDGDIEGFGMVLLEAQACGKPVLAGDSGGTAETMIPGETGFIVDCRAPEPLAKQVSALLCDSDHDGSIRDEMARAARAHAVKSFDWNSLARQAIALFDGHHEETRREFPPRPAIAR